MGQISATAFQAYDPTTAGSIVAGPLALYTVQVGSIDPTQLNEGYAEVGKKASAYDLQTAAQVQASLLASIEPVVIGPGGQLYLTDGHHTFTALDDSIFGASNPTVYVNVIANYSNLTTAQFFAQMQAGNLLLPLDNGVPETVDPTTGAPIPTTLTGLTNNPYRGLEYSILKNKNSKLFTNTSNITGATGSSTPGLDKMTGFYSDFLEAAAYQTANGGLGLSYLSPGDIALSTQWNLNGTSTFTLPNVSGPVTAAQLPGYILAQNLVQGGNIVPTVISNATLANGSLDGNGTFTGITTINAGTASNPIIIGTPNTGFVLQLGADRGFTVTLNGNNTYTGGTSLLAGTLIVTSDAALGAASTGAAIDTSNVKTSVQVANGIIFNSLAEGNATLQIGTASGGGTSTFTTNRAIAVGGEAATINVNGYLVSLTGQLYSLGIGPAGIGIGNATGFSDLTIDDSGSKGVLILSTASPNFYGNIIIGNANKPTVRVMNDAALGATTGSVYAIGQVVLNGGTLQAGASFSANERNITLTSGSTIDTAGFTTSWGTLSDTQRTITIANSSGTAGAITFASFNVASSATLVLSGTESTTFTNGIQRAGTASLIVQPGSSSALGSTEKLMSGTGAASVVDGIAPAWIVTNSGTGSAAGPYDFVTYGANGYVKATYGSTTLSSTTGTTSVALAGNTTASGNLAAYALNTSGKTITLGSNTLTIGDGTSADAAGLILASGSSISGGTLAFGGSEGVIWLSGSNPTISSTITGSNGLTFNGSGSVALNSAANLSGVVTINSGTVTLGAANVFASDASGVLLQDTKSTPAKATLAITANNEFSTLDSAGTNSAVTIATGTTLTIGDTTTNLDSTLSSTITGTGTATIVKAGSGLLDLSGGKVTSVSTISATGGELRVAVGTSGSVNYTLSNGADLQFAQNGGGQYSGAITGAGTLHLIGGTLQLTGTGNTYSGGTIVETGSTLDLTTANISSANANITDAGGLIVFDQATSGTYSGVISDGKEMGTGPMLSGSLLKDDSSGGNGGNLTLTSAQTYTGATYVEAGTLTLGVANAIATSSGITLGRVGGGAIATLALGANETVASLASNASNTTSVKLNGFTFTVAPTAGAISTFGGTIVDGTAAGQLVMNGAGTLVLSGANTYSGGTSLTSGTLDLTKVGAAGTGAITFATGAQTLDIEQAALNGDGSFTNMLSGFGIGDTIDLRGVGSETAATFDASTGKLTLSGGTESTILKLDGAAPTGYGYGLASDGHGGTLLSLDQKATVTSISTSPTNGDVKAGQTVTITITTNKAVSISGTNPILNLAGGGTATFTGIDATGTQLTFTDTVASGQDASGIQITGITNASSIQDGMHVPADLSGAINQASQGPVIDTTAPTLSITSTAGLTNQTTQIITGTVDAGDIGTTVTIYETYNGVTNAIGTAQVTSAMNGTSGQFSQSVNLTSGNGTHTIYTTDTDAAGNTGTSSSVSYDLETTAPSVTVTSAGGLTNSPTQTIIGTVDVTADPEAANSVISITDTSTGKVLATGATDASGHFSIGVTLSGEGSHALQVEDTDQANNSSFASVSYTLDTTAPTAPTVALTNDTGTSASDGITNDPSITYTPSASGDTLLYAADGSTTYTATPPVFTTDGSHTVSVEEQDPAGNVSSATTLTFTLDTTAPTTPPSVSLRHDTGTSSTDLITSDPTLSVSVGTSGDTLLYKADGATTYSTTAPSFATDGTQDGQHTLVIAEEDAAGNIGPATTITFKLDTTPPAAPTTPALTADSDSGSSSSDGITNVNAPTVTGVAEAGSIVTLYDGTTILATATASSTGAYSITAPALADGTHVLTATATDAAGNVSTASGGETVVIDTSAPATPGAPTLAAGSDTGSSSTDGITRATTPTLTGTAEAGSTVTLFDGTTNVGTTVAGSDGSYSITASTLADGPHALSVTATDAAGNVSLTSPSVTVTIDTQAPAAPGAPVLSSTSDSGTSSTDGVTNVTTPTVTGTAEAGSTIMLYDGSGTTVLGTAVAASNGTYSITSTTLTDGSHALHVTATDAAGNVSAASGNLTVLIDTTAPAVPAAPSLTVGSDSGISSSDGVTNVKTPTVTGTAEVGSIVTLYDGTTAIATATAGNTGAYSITAPTLADGTHVLTVTATDAAGNVSAASGGATVVIDTSAPATPGAPTLAAGSDTGSSLTDGITSVTTPTLTGTAEAGSTVTLFDGTINVGTAVAGSDGSYSITASTLADGAHALKVTATDVAGNVSASSSSVTVTIESHAPATPGTPVLSSASDSGPSSSDGITNVTSPTVTGMAAAGSTVTLYDGAGTTALGTTVAGSNGAYSITSTALAEGSHSLHVTATDTAGNVSATSGNLTVLIDTTAPDVPAKPSLTVASDSGSSASDGITNVTTPTVTGTAEAGSIVTLYDGTTKLATATAGSNGAYSIKAPTLADGTHVLTVTATDAAGNVSAASGGETVVIDTKAPVAPGAPTVTTSNSNTTADATPTATGTAEAGSVVTLFDGSTKVGTAVAGSDGSYSITASTLSNGSHTFKVTATDTAGNVSTLSAGRTFVIDATPPATPAAPTLAAGSDTGASATDGVTKLATPTVTGKAEAGATITLYDTDGTILGTAVATSKGVYSITPTSLSDGSHTLTVTAADAAGNVSQVSPGKTILIDTTPPASPAAPALVATSDTGLSATDGITNDKTPTVTGTAEAGSTVTLFEGTKKLGSVVVGATGAYTITSSSLADGAHSVYVTATDVAGNVSVVSPSLAVTVDTKAPAKPSTPSLTTMSDTGVSQTDGITNVATPTLTGTAEAGSTITLFDGKLMIGTTTASPGGTYSITAPTLANGSHLLHVTATDAAGNASAASGSRTVVIDTVTPVVAISTMGGSETKTTQTIKGTGEAGSTVTLVDTEAGGKMVTLGSVTVGANGSWSKSIKLAAGSNSIVATDADKAGNSATSQAATFTLGAATVAQATSSSTSAEFVQALFEGFFGTGGTDTLIASAHHVTESLPLITGTSAHHV